MRVRLLAASLLLACVAASAAVADPVEVVLKNGDVLRGEVTRTADAVVLEHPALGRLTIANAEVAAVRPIAAPAPAPAARPTPMAWQAFERPTARCGDAVVSQLCGGGDGAPAAPCAPKRCWKLKGGVAASLTAGNSDALAIGANLDYERERGPWKWSAGASFIYNQSDGDVTAERWLAYVRAEHCLSSRAYAFGKGTFDRDEPADLEYRLTGVGGAGYYFVKRDDLELKGEAGAGVTWEKRVDQSETVDPTGYLALLFRRTWASQREFKANLEFFPNLSDFDLSFGRLGLAYEMPLTDLIRLSLGARIDYVVSPPDGKDEVDLFLLLGVSFSI
jgi:putative salt-induced outer membrane protein YdiY